jgi:hypothetical protein
MDKLVLAVDQLIVVQDHANAILLRGLSTENAKAVVSLLPPAPVKPAVSVAAKYACRVASVKVLSTK